MSHGTKWVLWTPLSALYSERQGRKEGLGVAFWVANKYCLSQLYHSIHFTLEMHSCCFSMMFNT